jgi:thiamine biosynthesis lipoprotein
MQRLQQTRHALGSTAYLTVVLDDHVHSETIFDTLWQQIDTFEQRFSRFLPDSELSECNRTAGIQHSISPEFRDLLVTTQVMAERSDGLYSPFILPALQRAGYKGSWPQPHIRDEALNYEDRVAVVDWHEMTIGDTWVRIPKNTALDFGGIGKGYLLDQLDETLRTLDVIGYWLSLGGDILCSGHDLAGEFWKIGIQHARQETDTVASVTNHGQKLAVATSGTTKRQGVSDNGTWHHIIDPRTGQPAKTNVLTATVSADTATSTDVAAKCLVIAGSGSAEATLKTMDEQNALLQIMDGRNLKVMQLGAVWSV